jgi:hypothetical protein
MICNLLLMLASAAGPTIELDRIVVVGWLDVEVHSPEALIGVEHIR